MSGSSVNIGGPFPLPVSISASATENPMVTVGVEITRPADATPHAALDVVADTTTGLRAMTFTNMATIVGGNGIITKVRVMTDQKACVARFRLHLFDTLPTAIADNSPYLLLYANKTTAESYIDMPAMATEDSSNSTAAVSTNYYTRLPYVCAAADRNLYGILETLDIFTPAISQLIYVQLTAEQG
jgi:hypothetical protein